MKKLGFVVAVAILAVASFAGQAVADLGPLIPREVLFGNPEKASPSISPDGTRLAWLAPDKKNVLQVWVKTIGKDEKPFTITFPKEKPIVVHFFDQKMSVMIRGEEFTSGGRDFDAMDTTAVYKLRQTDVGLIAEREGGLKVYPPDYKPGKPLSLREKTLQQLLESKFSAALPPKVEFKELKLPEPLNAKGVLVTTQVKSDKGWLTLGWRLRPQ